MSARVRRGLLAAALGFGAIVGSSCLGSTGGDTFAFEGFVRGVPQGSFVNGRGFTIALTRAQLHVGAIYLNRAKTTSVAAGTTCTLTGIYVAEVPGGADVDLLSAEPAPFSVDGRATSDLAQTGEVWLTGGDVNEPGDSTVILDVAGTATRAGESYPFEAALTIGQNRLVTPTNPALPGAKPICKERVVTPIAVDIAPRDGGSLVLTVDPAGFFGNVDFSALEMGDDGTYRFRDDSGDQASSALYNGLHANAGVYSFEWVDAP